MTRPFNTNRNGRMVKLAMRRFRHLKLAAGLVLLAVLLMPLAHSLAYADVNDFVVNSFKADYSLTNKDPQGELHITEHIRVNFSAANHGILRAIPVNYKKHRLQLTINSVKSDSGAPVEYSTYGDHGNKVIKIGNNDRTVTGYQEYTIDYTLHNVISFYKDHDELYWDVNGDQWGQQIDKIDLTLHLPQSIGVPTAANCYTGSYGVSVRDCGIWYDQTQQAVEVSTSQPLTPKETLTIAVGFKKGYFQPAKWYQTAAEYAGPIVGFLLTFLVVSLPAFVYWFRRGRDPKGRGVIVPEYDAPDKLSAIEVGTIIDFSTDNKDITATIIGLAIRGHIKIIETKKDRKLLGSSTKYTLKLLKPAKNDLTPYEATLMDGIFGKSGAGKEVSLDDLKFKLDKVAAGLRKDVKSGMLEQGYFQRHPVTARFIVACVLVFAIWLALLITAVQVFDDEMTIVGVVAGTVFGLILAILFLIFARSRTVKGVEAKEHIMGLKLYIKTAEADRIKMLQSPDAKYAPKSKEPARTVDLFEKLLPYAMVLGVEGEWAKKFEDIYRTPPDWYSGNWTTFSAIYLVSSLNQGVSGAVNTAFSAPTNASGSGIGGGFAGGGGGGGGGGGW